MSNNLNIAILSPNKNAYSETFIQAQKSSIEGNIFFYFNGFMPTKLEGEGSILIKYAGLKRKLGLFRNDIKLESLKRSFRMNKIDVVLAQYGPTGNTVAPICKKLGIPLIVHFHGYDASVNSVIEKYHNYKDVYEIAARIICVSKQMEKMLLELGCPKNKLVYNVYGPQPQFETIMPTYSKKQFIAIGRFTDKKAPYYTIMAFKRVLKKHPDAKLLMAGDGILLNTCENLIKHHNIEKNISLLGVITPEEYQNLLEVSLAFVQHSVTAINGDMEGTPLAVLEASAAGLPVVATYHAGIPDVIEHEKTGLLCVEHDVEGMSNNMLRLLEDIDYARQLGMAGKQRISEYFTLKRHIKTLQTILEQAV